MKNTPLHCLLLSLLFLSLSSCAEKDGAATVGFDAAAEGAIAVMYLDKQGEFHMASLKTGEQMKPCSQRTESTDPCRSSFHYNKVSGKLENVGDTTILSNQSIQAIRWVGSECIVIYWKGKRYEICSPPH